MSQQAKRVVLASRPVGEPKSSDFRIEDYAPPTPGEGEVLLRTIWLSLDPYMRGRMSDGPSYAQPVPIDGVMSAQPRSAGFHATPWLSKLSSQRCAPWLLGSKP